MNIIVITHMFDHSRVQILPMLVNFEHGALAEERSVDGLDAWPSHQLWRCE